VSVTNKQTSSIEYAPGLWCGSVLQYVAQRVGSCVLRCVAVCCSGIGFEELCRSHTTFGHLMVWLRLVGSLKLQFSFAKEPYKRDYTLQKRPITTFSHLTAEICVGWLRLVGSLKSTILFCKRVMNLHLRYGGNRTRAGTSPKSHTVYDLNHSADRVYTIGTEGSHHM